jgi:hypothetical protein
MEEKTDKMIEKAIDRIEQACDNCIASEVKVLSEALLILADAKIKLRSLDRETKPPTASS